MSAVERAARLQRAIQLFSNIRRLDEKAVIPSLLICHAYLECYSTSSVPLTSAAINSLIDAARRRPEVFAERPNIAAHFGDVDPQTGRSATLERQLRRYARIAAEKSTSDVLVLQAYCAWMLGDSRRAAESLSKAEELLAGGEQALPQIQLLIAALRYAL